MVVSIDAVGTGVNCNINNLRAVYGWSTADWQVAALIAVGTAGGGWLGGRYGRQIPEPLLRRTIVVTGLVVAVVLALRLR